MESNTTETEYAAKIQTVFREIDLAQARITVKQDEIKTLALETDKLLEQLEYRTI